MNNLIWKKYNERVALYDSRYGPKWSLSDIVKLVWQFLKGTCVFSTATYQIKR